MSNLNRSRSEVSRRDFLYSAVGCSCCLASPLSTLEAQQVDEAADLGPFCLNSPNGEPQQGEGTKAIVALQKRWSKDVLRIRFLNGHNNDWGRSLHDKVKSISTEWCEYANRKFEFVTQGPADIKINFEGRISRFDSFVGTDASSVDTSMNLIFLKNQSSIYSADRDRGYRYLILHEFGHALGLLHEHQRPNNIVWMERPLYDFAWQKWRWKPEVVDQQILTPQDSRGTGGTAFDVASVMMYDYPPGLAFYQKEGAPPKTPDYDRPFSSTRRPALSPLDKIAVAEAYPLPGSLLNLETFVPGDPTYNGKIAAAGQVARFRLRCPEAGKYRVRVEGRMPALISFALYSERANEWNPILNAIDKTADKSGEIEFETEVSQAYEVKVRHAQPLKGTGEFQITASSV